MPQAQELPIDTTANADDRAEAIFGDGADIVSPTFSGASGASGIYTKGDSVAPGITPSDTGVTLSTGKATAVTGSSGDANAVSSASTNDHTAGDCSLGAIAGAQTHDAAVPEADFVPQDKASIMQITFSSEEYLEYPDSHSNDAVNDAGWIDLTTTAACFTAGTRIDTPGGHVRIEKLSPGDMVTTRDAGDQPLLWVGVTLCRASGALAPVCLRTGILGARRSTEVSPNHRLLLSGSEAELHFGHGEVLVKACDLVNGGTVTRREDGGRVAYVYLLFERHQIVCGDGVWSESYQPGDQILRTFDADTRAEILALFPELACRTDAYGPTVRPVLRPFEAALLASTAPVRRSSPPAEPCPSAP